MSSLRYKVQRQFDLLGGKTDIQWVSFYDKERGVVGYDSQECMAIELKPADTVALALELNKGKCEYWAYPRKRAPRQRLRFETRPTLVTN